MSAGCLRSAEWKLQFVILQKRPFSVCDYAFSAIVMLFLPLLSAALLAFFCKRHGRSWNDQS